jgi:hypothetical protein
MAAWWGAGECLHYVMTHQLASCIFWCPDQDRAELCIRYCKRLYAQQDQQLKELYPLPRKKKHQRIRPFTNSSWPTAAGSRRCRARTPTRSGRSIPRFVLMDEAAFNPDGGEAFDNAISTQPYRLIGVSSIKQSWFSRLIDPASWLIRRARGFGWAQL